MKKIGLISITMNAVPPMEHALRAFPELEAFHYCDTVLQGKIAKAGITDESMSAMLSMIGEACRDGMDGIILTCTMFSQYAPVFRRLFSVPIIGADVAMMEQAAAQEGKKALLCTFERTREPSFRLLQKCCREAGREDEIDVFVLDGAMQAAAQGDPEEHNRIIRQKICGLQQDYDQIILAQMSMADAATGLAPGRAAVYTSPKAACETMMAYLKQENDQ